MAQEVSIEFFSGNTVRLKFTISDEDLPPGAKDLTGATDIRFAIAKSQGKAAVLEKTLGSGITVTDGPNGKMEVDLSKADTEPLGEKHTYHETRVTDGAGNTATVAYGTATIQPNTITA